MLLLRKKKDSNKDYFPSDRYAYKTNEADPIYIPVNRISTPYQTEDALDDDRVKENVASINKGKALQPVVIGYKYDLHDGHHRLEAAKRVGHTHVPCIVGGRNERRVKAAEKRYRKIWKSMIFVQEGRLLIKATTDKEQLSEDKKAVKVLARIKQVLLDAEEHEESELEEETKKSWIEPSGKLMVLKKKNQKTVDG